MTAKQQRFAQEYLVDLNAAQAALRAGYSPGCAPTHGSNLLRRPDIAAYVAEAQAARAARTQITADRVVAELAKIAFGNPRRLLAMSGKGIALRDGDELSDAEAALISEITEIGTGTRRIKLHCKMTALTALAKHLGLFSGALAPPGAAEDGADEAAQGESARERLARRLDELAARLGTDDTSEGTEQDSS
jgi:phage terminase small subunit